MKNVLITGSASGMGRETALLLANNGYNVFGLDINKTEDCSNITQIICDVSDINSVESAYKEVSSKVSKLDAIIHFAGIIMMNSLVEISEQDFLKILEITCYRLI